MRVMGQVTFDGLEGVNKFICLERAVKMSGRLMRQA